MALVDVQETWSDDDHGAEVVVLGCAGMARFRTRLEEALATARSDFEATLGAPDALATLQMRPLGARLAFLFWGAALHADGSDEAILTHFLDRHLGPPAPRDERYLARIASVSGLES